MSAQFERVELSTTIDLDGYDDVEVEVTGIFLPAAAGEEEIFEIETVASVDDVPELNEDNIQIGFKYRAGEILILDREQEEALIAKLWKERGK